ncbi:MAG TPA: hypothetical protein DCR35_17430 [Runella sp.]|nr:hypothetical protein [Runella sp.]HAO50925.1 hypothetical protein [Runella sp.]
MENTLELTYSYFNHLHNYAIWTAARAAQRGFTTTKNIKTAIEKTELKDLLEGNKPLKSVEEFDTFHEKCCEFIMAEISQLGIKGVTYGRAAKIVNIYIKTAIVIPNPDSQLAFIAHPPVDRILLIGLTEQLKVKFHKISWTGFDQKDYLKIITQFRELGFGLEVPFWKIEKYWNPVRETQVDI